MTRYEAGRRFEWKERDFWKNKGYYVIRSAGSKGLFDLVCLPDKHEDAKPLGIQLKEYSGSRPKPPKEFVDAKVKCHKWWVTRKKGSRWNDTERELID